MADLILDYGGLNIRLGRMTNQTPSMIIQNKYLAMNTENLFEKDVDFLFGQDADFLSSCYNVVSTVENGRITDWLACEKIWNVLFKDLFDSNSGPNMPDKLQRNLYFTASLNYTSRCYERLCEYFIGKLGVERLSFGIDSINALYSIGKTTGLVIDSGDSCSKIFSIVDGFLLP